MSPENLRTVRQLAEECPAFSQASIRWAIFHAQRNGLAPALVRVGRRVLIDKASFATWLERHRQAPPEPERPRARRAS
jgi:hypothetical protein